MSNCHVSNQIAINADEPSSDECEKCNSSVTASDEGGYEILICDKYGHKVWADGDEY